MSRWGDPNERIENIFKDEGTGAESKLKGNAKKMTVGEMWRLGAFKKDSHPAVHKDAKMKVLSLEETNSLADAIETHINHPNVLAKVNREGWKYNTDYPASCCCCTTCE